MNYIAPGNHTFYISGPERLLSCWFFGETLVFRGSYFEWPSPSSNLETVIAQFVSAVDEQQLESRNAVLFRIDLRPGAPLWFFSTKSLGGAQPATPTIKAIDLTDYILRLDTRSDGDKASGTFYIDLKARKVVKVVVEGKEMDLSALPHGKPIGGSKPLPVPSQPK